MTIQRAFRFVALLGVLAVTGSLSTPKASADPGLVPGASPAGPRSPTTTGAGGRRDHGATGTAHSSLPAIPSWAAK
jgi:hypothetical protein